MRPQLLLAGLLVMLLGATFYFLELPFAFYWSVPFVIGGAAMAIASPFVSESPGPVRPAEGYRFCRFCSAQIPSDSERCPHCNGIQPKEGG